jgi:hypothetical protein
MMKKSKSSRLIGGNGVCLKGPRILIVCPHGKCEVGKRCDLLAWEAAKLLKSLLNQNGRLADLLMPRITRSECDLNRFECRDNTYRKRLRGLVKSGIYFLVVDVHSFHAGHGRVGSFGLPYTPLMLLDHCADGRPTRLSRYIQNVMRAQTGHQVRFPLLCSQLGDIRTEMQFDLKTPCLSLEFNQDLGANDLRFYCALLTGALTP